MLDLGRFCAWVTVEDLEAPEYGVEISQDGESATCWIASEVDKTFAVHWQDMWAHDSTGGYVCVDGVSVGGKLNRIGRRSPLQVSTAVASSNTERPLIFSRTDYTEDDAYLDQLSPDHGTITLRIDQIKVTQETPRPTSAHRFAPYQTTKVHERSKKFLHSIKFGSERPSGITSWATTETLRKGIASFTFRYRSIEILRDLKIAPAPLPNAPQVRDNARGIADEDVKPEIIEIDTELQELQSRMDALKERKNAINQVKREPAIPVFLHGEVIDLT